jgi:hypothetical protein
MKPLASVAVTGRVLDSLERPYANARVSFFHDEFSLDPFYAPEEARTDSTGSYSLELASGTWDVVVLIPAPPPLHGGWHRAYRLTVAPEHPRVDFRIEGYRVEGRVLGPTGAVLDSGGVSAYGQTGAAAGGRFQSGKFYLILPPSTYDFFASSSGLNLGYPIRILRGVPVSADTSFDIALEGDPISGIVTGHGGAPLESLLVTASGETISSNVRTGPDGRYLLYVPPGDYRFRCYPHTRDSHILPRIFPVRTVTGPSVIDLDLAGVLWSGTVRLATTLQPIDGAHVAAGLFGDAYGRYAESTTDAAGQFRLILEPNREYALRFSAEGTAQLGYPSIVATTVDQTFDILLDPLPTP